MTTLRPDASASLPDVFARAWEVATCGAGANAVRVGLAEVDAWQPWAMQAWELLDEAERGRIARLRRPSDRQARTLAYALHRLALAAELRLPWAKVPLWRDALGCPRVGEGDVHTSLSHCDGAIAWAIGRDGAVGVDLEPVTRRALMLELAPRICHPDEALALAALAQARREIELLSLWVRKEAVLKAAGIGMAVDMACFRSDTPHVPATPDLPVSTWVQPLDIGETWVAALATVGATPTTVAWLRP